MAAESLSAMLEKEQTIYHHCKNKCDYLLHHHRRSSNNNNNNNNNNEASVTAVTENARIKIIDWFYSVIDKCQFDRSTVAMATDIMDRYLSVSSSSNSNSDSSSQHEHDASLLPRHSSLKQFQLVAITSLYIAIKTNEVIVISSSFFAAMSRYDYSSADIEAMELLILQTLKWHIYAPTVVQIAYTVLSSLMLLLPHDDGDDNDASSSLLHDDIINNNNHESSMLWENIVDEVQYQSELAVRDYKLCIQYRPSTLALAIIINTIVCSNNQQNQNHKNQNSCNNNNIGMEKRRDKKKAILRALLLVMKDHHHHNHNREGEEHSFDTFDTIMRARRRLRHIVEAVYTSGSSSSNSHDDDDDDVRETVSIVSGGGETM